MKKNVIGSARIACLCFVVDISLSTFCEKNEKRLCCGSLNFSSSSTYMTLMPLLSVLTTKTGLNDPEVYFTSVSRIQINI